MNFNHLKQNKKKLFLAAAVLWLLVCVFVTPVFTLSLIHILKRVTIGYEVSGLG